MGDSWAPKSTTGLTSSALVSWIRSGRQDRHAEERLGVASPGLKARELRWRPSAEQPATSMICYKSGLAVLSDTGNLPADGRPLWHPEG